MKEITKLGLLTFIVAAMMVCIAKCTEASRGETSVPNVEITLDSWKYPVTDSTSLK
jgi:hypothetical protein